MKTEDNVVTPIPNPQSPILFIVGPTASGKSNLAMQLAETLGGEIVAADSQTIRRSMDIGTAKPSHDEQRRVKHHMIDIIDPYEEYNVARFQDEARAAIGDIQTRGLLPIVVGGTGLYIDSLFYGYSLSDQNLEVRAELNAKSVEELQKIIRQNGYGMPENDRNPRHLIGVISRAGSSPADKIPVEGALMVGIDVDEDTLKARISSRIDKMIGSGLIDEVRSLVSRYGKPSSKIDAIAYPIFIDYLDSKVSLDKAKELFSQSDWQYARRQKSWLRRNKHINWLQSDDRLTETLELIKNS
ncbi:MAG: tRNA dimethylallyltransferase [Candidatus Saccharimonadales bacterium]|jgi:tRNA dimethylallyltransferase